MFESEIEKIKTKLEIKKKLFKKYKDQNVKVYFLDQSIKDLGISLFIIIIKCQSLLVYVNNKYIKINNKF